VSRSGSCSTSNISTHEQEQEQEQEQGALQEAQRHHVHRTHHRP
jgi:hypothetical protein